MNSSENGQSLGQRLRQGVITVFGVAICLFTVLEMNYPQLQQQSALALFIMMGLVICFLESPLHDKFKDWKSLRVVDALLAGAVVVCCGYVVVQLEPAFESFWAGGESLGDRAGSETDLDILIGAIGLLLVFESTRRAIGWIVPALAAAFVLHTYYCYASIEYEWPEMPDWLLPHAGQSAADIVSTTYIQTLGVFGPAAGVMFKYVFLFVVFGAFLEMSGATQFIIDFSERVFGGSPGGPAKVSVLGSGLMGSLSGSAVANAVTTGTFTIPMMRNVGFQPHVAGGITAAAASGGALVPPVMGAGAYMMLEIVEPNVTFVQVATAAAIPAVLYYLSIWMIVHFYSRRVGQTAARSDESARKQLSKFEATVFFGALVALIGLLLDNYTPFKAVSGSLMVIMVCTVFRRELPLSRPTRIGAIGVFAAIVVVNQLQALWIGVLPDTLAAYLSPYQPGPWTDPSLDEVTRRAVMGSLLNSGILGTIGLFVFGLCQSSWRPSMLQSMGRAAKNGVSLVAASACVGIIIGVVQQTGIATDFSAVIKGVVATNLLLALLGIMICSIILGMGVPSVVCYLLMATLMGSLLGELGVIPLAAHLFIFYFGMMSMVTPPVALAAYASASIAKARIMQTGLAAFRFSLVGFTLPFMFVYRPALLLMDGEKWSAWMSAKSDGNLAEAATLLKEAQAAYAPWDDLAIAVITAVVGVVALAAGISGFCRREAGWGQRAMFMAAAAMLLYPELILNCAGGGLFLAAIFINSRGQGAPGTPPEDSRPDVHIAADETG